MQFPGPALLFGTAGCSNAHPIGAITRFFHDTIDMPFELAQLLQEWCGDIWTMEWWVGGTFQSAIARITHLELDELPFRSFVGRIMFTEQTEGFGHPQWIDDFVVLARFKPRFNRNELGQRMKEAIAVGHKYDLAIPCLNI